jgi:hypothetical protein
VLPSNIQRYRRDLAADAIVAKVWTREQPNALDRYGNSLTPSISKNQAVLRTPRPLI